MFFTAHLAAGLIVGALTGNYLWAILGAELIDIDHLVVYARAGILFKPKKFWAAITDPKDPYGDQRNYTHSFFPFIVIALIAYVLESKAAMIFSLGYLSHLLLDMIDSSDFYPFYPITEWNFKGPIGYLSRLEKVLTVLMFTIFILLII